ncbi:MAG: glycoside hydrolase family 3 N-terminal domain-containing protein [Propionicimonas sp.]|nr:glycoside hydrolase family 3 N-terminal domain-containing protein [Propionicimonas sp.]
MRRWVMVVAVTGLLAGCAVTPPEPPGSNPPLPTRSTTSPAATPPATPTPSPSPTPTCRATAEELSPAERAGQVVMVGVAGSLDRAERKAITDHHLGAVILMGGSARGVSKTAALTDSLQDLAGDLGILVAVDQEGGLVQRLKGTGFSTIPSAAEQARWSPDELTERATEWAEQLVAAGVQLNLAPVADVVPRRNVSANEPVAGLRRGYGTDPEKVSRHVLAFLAGMHAGGVATAVKHFPGLGAVKGNTDFADDVVDDTTTADSDLLVPFWDALAAGTEAVMVSSAVYRRIDPDAIAGFSPAVVALLRDAGFDGVVVSDDLGAAKALAGVPARERAVRFLAAGGDLAISVDPAVAGDMAEGLVERAADDQEFAARLVESAARVLALKQAHGLVDCD